MSDSIVFMLDFLTMDEKLNENLLSLAIKRDLRDYKKIVVLSACRCDRFISGGTQIYEY